MQWRIEVPGQRAHLGALLDAIEQALRENGIDAGVRETLRLIAEEVVCNAMDYGGGPQKPPHQIAVDIRRRDDRLHVEFRDTGLPFNPLEQAPPDLDADILDRPIGGLGVHLVREFAETVHYLREDPYNILRVVLHAH